jgi:hypothetical protein
VAANRAGSCSAAYVIEEPSLAGSSEQTTTGRPAHLRGGTRAPGTFRRAGWGGCSRSLDAPKNDTCLGVFLGGRLHDAALALFLALVHTPHGAALVCREDPMRVRAFPMQAGAQARPSHIGFERGVLRRTPSPTLAFVRQDPWLRIS